MALGKTFGVFDRKGETYGVLLERRNVDESILLESEAVIVLNPSEKETMKSKYDSKLFDAYGCLGIVSAPSGQYLVMVTGLVSVGEIGDGIIYRITQTTFLSLKGPPASDEVADQKVADLKKLLNSGFFYFGWAPAEKCIIDITMCAQRRLKTQDPDTRFFWNRFMHLPFLRSGVDRYEWLLVVICGSVDIRTIFCGVKKARAVLFARISSERAGTRFHMRGINDDGSAANFVETEQAVFCDNDESSFVQIRGSVPIFWEQPGIQVGSHKIRIMREFQATVFGFQRHVNDLRFKYGHQVFVNLLSSSLVGSKEGEASLSQFFEELHKFLPECQDIEYVAFDFHQECRGGVLNNLSKLKNKLESYLEAHGVFCSRTTQSAGEQEIVNKKVILAEQLGTIRTNCLDCLDRTNSVQTFLGLEMLNKQLELMGLLRNRAHTASRFREVFQQLWTNIGNELSRFSTGAGINSGGSVLMDVSRTAARTLQNNLLDTNKQEAIDLLLGNASNDFAEKARCLLPASLLHAPPKLLREMVNRSSSYLQTSNMRIAVGTYNVNGGNHFKSVVYRSVSLSDWLLDYQSPDESTDSDVEIFAIGVQEIVDLNAKNIASASTTNAKKWAEELEKIISRDKDFTMITYVQLVGVCLFLFAKPYLIQHVRDVAVDSVKTGFGGATGNKGAVSVRFLLYNTSLAFVCAHFAAGQSQVAERNADYAEITRKISFAGRPLIAHDYVFWCGDFNYRVDMPRDQIMAHLRRGELAEVLAQDQLKKEQAAGRVFNQFTEGPIGFEPTYKYDLFSDDYDTSEKQRSPAWTDRVLWRNRRQYTNDLEPFTPVRNIFYGRAELKQSDHRPVISVIEMDIYQIDETKRTNVFSEVIQDIGPPDATIVVQPEETEFEVFTDDFMQAVISEFNVFGVVIFIRYVDDKVMLTFADSEAALAASRKGHFTVCGVKLFFSLNTPNWEHLYDEEMNLCNSRTAAMNDDMMPLLMPEEPIKVAITNDNNGAVAAGPPVLEPEPAQARELPAYYLNPIRIRDIPGIRDELEGDDDVYAVIAEEDDVVYEVLPMLPPPPPPRPSSPPPVPPRAGIPPPIPPRRDPNSN